MPAVVQQMAALVDGLDVASANELRCALDTSMPAQKISFAGPGKTDAELSQAIASEVLIHIESETELERVDQISQRLGICPKIVVRVNPDFELKSSGMKMGGGAKPFGIDAENVPAILHRLSFLGLDFHGFQIFCGSQNLKTQAIIDAQINTFALAIRLAGDAPCAPRLLNIGGGFGIPYFPGDTPLNLQPIADHLHRLP